MQNIRIRQGTADEMLSLWYRKHSSEYMIHKMEHGEAEFWTIEERGRLLGELYLFKVLSDKDFADGKTTAHLCAFRIIKEMRGRGLGTKLLKRVFTRCRELNYQYLTIGVEPGAKANARLYLRMGFVEKIKTIDLEPEKKKVYFEPGSHSKFILLRKEL